MTGAAFFLWSTRLPAGANSPRVVTAMNDELLVDLLNERRNASERVKRIADLDQGLRLVVCNFWLLPGSPWTAQTLWD